MIADTRQFGARLDGTLEHAQYLFTVGVIELCKDIRDRHDYGGQDPSFEQKSARPESAQPGGFVLIRHVDLACSGMERAPHASVLGVHCKLI